MLDGEESHRAERDGVAAADSFGDQLVLGHPFEFVLNDRSVNEWLAALPRAWPEWNELLPRECAQPVVRFEQDLIRIGVRIQSNRWESIVSAGTAVQIADADSVMIALRDVKSGAMPIPAAILRRMVRFEDGNEHSNPSGTSVRGSTNGMARPGASSDSPLTIDRLFEGYRVGNRFVWPNGERPFRIASLTLTSGELRLRIEPLGTGR